MSHCAVQDGFELVILLPQFSSCGSYRGSPSHPVFVDCVFCFVASLAVGKTKREGLLSVDRDPGSSGCCGISESVSLAGVGRLTLASQPENAPESTSQQGWAPGTRKKTKQNKTYSPTPSQKHRETMGPHWFQAQSGFKASGELAASNTIC